MAQFLGRPVKAEAERLHVFTALYAQERKYEPSWYDPSTGINFRQVPADSIVDDVEEIELVFPKPKHLTTPMAGG